MLPDLNYFLDLVRSYLPEPHATMLNGIVFGEAIKSDVALYEKVKTTGLLHIVVLSGMNITILSTLINRATQKLSKWMSLLLTTISILFFVILVRPQAPIIRAVIMSYITIVAFITQRVVRPIVALLISALVIAIFWPEWITSLSFLLSFFSTLGIVLFAQNGSDSSLVDRTSISNLVKSDLKTSISATLMTSPLILIYFNEISLISPISTLIVGPLIAPLMILTFLMVLAGSINWYFGLIPGLLCYGISSVILLIINLLSKVPFIFIDFK